MVRIAIPKVPGDTPVGQMESLLARMAMYSAFPRVQPVKAREHSLISCSV